MWFSDLKWRNVYTNFRENWFSQKIKRVIHTPRGARGEYGERKSPPFPSRKESPPMNKNYSSEIKI
jgi:hypothetical protein